MPMKSLTKKPGEFKAVCRLGAWLPVLDVPPGLDTADLQSRWDRNLAQEVYLVECDLVTTDRAEYEQHMKRRHDGGLYRWESGSLSPSAAGTTVRNHTPRMAIPVKMWSGPALKAEGKPLPEPKGLEPGARVTWEQYVSGRKVERAGSVWCTGHAPKSAWAIPDEPLDVGEHRLERAVLVVQGRVGGLYEQETWTVRRETEAAS